MLPFGYCKEGCMHPIGTQSLLAMLAVLADMDDKPVKQQRDPDAPPEPLKKGGNTVKRNDRCPCGNGKKFKHCCYKV